MSREHIGKCEDCRRIVKWTGRIPLSLAFCPLCGQKLLRTTHANRWPCGGLASVWGRCDAAAALDACNLETERAEEEKCST